MDANEREIRESRCEPSRTATATERGINSFIRVYSRPFAVLLASPLSVSIRGPAFSVSFAVLAPGTRPRSSPRNIATKGSSAESLPRVRFLVSQNKNVTSQPDQQRAISPRAHLSLAICHLSFSFAPKARMRATGQTALEGVTLNRGFTEGHRNRG
jgi:hypothetical protein